MTTLICPCNGCVPPKRTSTCHSTCKDYKKWKIAYNAESAMIRENRRKHYGLFSRQFE